MKKTTSIVQKIVRTTAVVAFLLPNVMGGGVALAEEAEQPTEVQPQQDRDEITQLTVNTVYPYSSTITGTAAPGARVDVDYPGISGGMATIVRPDGTWTITSNNLKHLLEPGSPLRVTVRVSGQDYVYDNEFSVAEAREVGVRISVRTPNNMYEYADALEDFTNHPVILTNRVTGETFEGNVLPNDSNSPNNFTIGATVHAYERGYHEANDYDITLPQELIDLGYSLSRDHRVRSNFGIVGTTNLSYNAPQDNENVGELSRNVSDYGYIAGRDLEIFLISADGTRTYNLGSRDLAIPSGEYTVRIANSPADSQPELVLRESSLTNAPEIEIELTQDGEDYVGTVTLDFTNSTRPQVFKVSPAPLDVTYTVTIDPNGGEINDEYRVTEVTEGETYTLEYAYKLGLNRTGYDLAGYQVDGRLLNANGNEVTEINRFTAEYTPLSDVTLTPIWEVRTGEFQLIVYDEEATQDKYDVTFTHEDGTSYDLEWRYIDPGYSISWDYDEMPYGTYTLSIDGFNITDANLRGFDLEDSNISISEDGSSLSVHLGYPVNYSAAFAILRVYGEPIPEIATYPLGVEVRDLDNRRTSEVGVTVTDEDGVVFDGSYDEYNLWTTTEGLLEGTYTITLTTPEGTYAEINDTVASQAAQPTDEANVFTIEVNEETQGSLSRVFGAFRLVEIPEPAPETDADHHEPVFVDEIVLDLNRGNGKLKNPKTLVENMNEMPGGFKIDYTNLDEIDLSGETTDTQMVEITVTYRDGSTDVVEVPLRVLPKGSPKSNGRPW